MDGRDDSIVGMSQLCPSLHSFDGGGWLEPMWSFMFPFLSLTIISTQPSIFCSSLALMTESSERFMFAFELICFAEKVRGCRL